MKLLSKAGLWAALALSLLITASRSGAAPVHLAGRVVKDTGGKNGPGVPGATVQLWRIVVGADHAPHGEKMVATAKSNATGHFDFGVQELAPKDVFTARVEWGGYPYEVPAYLSPEVMQRLNLTVVPDKIEVQVLDSTPALDFTEQAHHIAIETRQGGLKCIERIVVNNSSGRVFLGTGADRITYRLALPPGAREVQLDKDIVDAKLVKTGDGYGISKPIWPSHNDTRNAIIVSYLMDWPSAMPWGRSIDLSRTLLYPVNFYFVARTEADRALKVQAPALGPDQVAPLPLKNGMETRIINAIGFPMSEKPALGAGTQVAIKVSKAVNPLFWAFVLFVVALCLVVPLALWHGPPRDAARGFKTSSKTGSKNGTKIAEPASGTSVYRGTLSRNAVGADVKGVTGETAALATLAQSELSEAARTLIEQIARLDDEWEAGTLQAEAYQARRAVWKEQLITLLSTNERSSE